MYSLLVILCYCMYMYMHMYMCVICMVLTSNFGHYQFRTSIQKLWVSKIIATKIYLKLPPISKPKSFCLEFEIVIHVHCTCIHNNASYLNFTNKGTMELHVHLHVNTCTSKCTCTLYIHAYVHACTCTCTHAVYLYRKSWKRKQDRCLS